MADRCTITRRQFTAATGSALTLTVLGATACREQPDELDTVSAANPHRARLATEPFLVGSPDRYLTAGVYEPFKREYGVWLYSDGRFLVALSATCTHLGCSTLYDRQGGQYRCPCHGSLFTVEGLNKSASKAQRPLERCLIRLVQTRDGPQVQVDPTIRYRQERKEWMHPLSMLRLSPTT